MNNTPLNKEIWTALRKKWTTLEDISKVEFTILSDPLDASRVLAIDIAQNISGKWVVQTVQKQVREAYPVIGIESMSIDQLINLAIQIIGSVTVPVTNRENHDDEMHLVMKRISPVEGEISGYVKSITGEKIGVRSNYQHYYVINEILEQKSKILQEELSEVRLHRKKNDSGRIHFQFIPSRDIL